MHLHPLHALYTAIRHRDMPGSREARAARSAMASPAVSRRQFLTTAAAVPVALGVGRRGAAAAAEHGLPPSTAVIEECSAAPVPIPGGTNVRRELFGDDPRFPDRVSHTFLPGPGVEPATIFHFRGEVALLDIHGTGTRTVLDPLTGAVLQRTPHHPFTTHVRFMDGEYLGVDGRQHRGTFGFY
jgi:hypothetical protein